VPGPTRAIPEKAGPEVKGLHNHHSPNTPPCSGAAAESQTVPVRGIKPSSVPIHRHRGQLRSPAMARHLDTVGDESATLSCLSMVPVGIVMEVGAGWG
jgi:hypothetical protein